MIVFVKGNGQRATDNEPMGRHIGLAPTQVINLDRFWGSTEEDEEDNSSWQYPVILVSW